MNTQTLEKVETETKIIPRKEEEAAPAREERSPEMIMGEDSITQAERVATSLQKIIEKQKLYADIQGKKFVTVEGWTTLGAIMRVFPEVITCEQVPHPESGEIEFLAEVRVKGMNGLQITKAQGSCSNAEILKTRNGNVKRWNDTYAVRSMAQTRATGKAFRLAFSWIMKMAGYEACAAEEMEAAAPVHARAQQTEKAEDRGVVAEYGEIYKLIGELHPRAKNKEKLSLGGKIYDIKNLTEKEGKRILATLLAAKGSGGEGGRFNLEKYENKFSIS